MSPGDYEKSRANVLLASVDAAERAAAGVAKPSPDSLRANRGEGAGGIGEMTWSWFDV